MPRCPNCNEESYLTTAHDILHAEVIGSLLASFGIPYYLKYRGAGDYLKVVYGMTSFGIDIFVPGSVYQHAYQLLNDESEIYFEKTENDEDEFNELAFDRWYRRYQLRRCLAAIILLFM